MATLTAGPVAPDNPTNTIGPFAPTFTLFAEGSLTDEGAANWSWVSLTFTVLGAKPSTSTRRKGDWVKPDPVTVIMVPAGPDGGMMFVMAGALIVDGEKLTWRNVCPTAPPLPSILMKYVVPPVTGPEARLYVCPGASSFSATNVSEPTALPE